MEYSAVGTGSFTQRHEGRTQQIIYTFLKYTEGQAISALVECQDVLNRRNQSLYYIVHPGRKTNLEVVAYLMKNINNIIEEFQNEEIK